MSSLMSDQLSIKGSSCVSVWDGNVSPCAIDEFKSIDVRHPEIGDVPGKG
jgi:hypothetical protein